MSIIKKLLSLDKVLLTAILLSIISVVIIPPDKEYLSYIDLKTIVMLFCLMLVVNGFKSISLFDRLGRLLTAHARTTRAVAMYIILLCFFSSMLITNDVALITFVPFTIILFSDSNSRTQLPYVITIETIAANLGSMLTPIGNPQSLYIYSLSNMTLTGFISTMLPYSILSLMLIMLSLLSIKAYPVNSSAETGSLVNQGFGIKLTVYILLFAVCMLNVLHILSYYAVLIITVTVIFITDRALFKSVDYILLLTFAFFFIFIGNIGRIPAVNGLLSSAIVGREALSGILCSQFMSNVPATILLSGFTVNYGSLLIGVNIGGLGTMIASMASLISYRQYKQTNIKSSHSYMFIFSIYNIIFLIALVCLYLFI